MKFDEGGGKDPRKLLTKRDAKPSMFINDISRLFMQKVRRECEKSGISHGYHKLLMELSHNEGATQLQLVKLTHDGTILNPFIFEMNDMPNSLKVSTALVILDSGNKAAIEAFEDNKAFAFNDMDGGKIQTREDIIQFGKDNPDSEQSDGFSATTGSTNGK